MTVRRVSFVDTSVLCNLLPVPGFDDDRDQAVEQMRARECSGETLILPVTTVIETGNFIAQIPDGRVRRTTAQTFSKMLRMVIDNRAPWQLHRFTWDDAFLRELIVGAGTGIDLVDQAVRRFGCGDLCILAERQMYAARATLASVEIWTMDAVLAAHS